MSELVANHESVIQIAFIPVCSLALNGFVMSCGVTT